MRERLEDFGHVVRPGAWGLVALAPGFEYREQPPPTALKEVVACVWSSRVTKPSRHLQRTLPDGCVEIVLAGDGPALVYGPDGGWSDVPLAGGAAHCGVRLRPGAGRAVLRVDLHELAGLVAPLDDVEPSGRLDSSCLARLLAGVAKTRAQESDSLALEAAHRMELEPCSRVADLARCLSISERQLRRRFERTVGLRPVTYARITRMQRAVRLALHHGWSWSTVAYEAGFSDQAHLTREVQEFTGYSPSRLIVAPDG